MIACRRGIAPLSSDDLSLVSQPSNIRCDLFDIRGAHNVDYRNAIRLSERSGGDGNEI
jgi:hypothetical protein